jgi:hypothetical protein
MKKNFDYPLENVKRNERKSIQCPFEIINVIESIIRAVQVL